MYFYFQNSNTLEATETYYWGRWDWWRANDTMTPWLLKIVLIPELHKCSQGYVTQTPTPKKANKNTARKLKQAAAMVQSAIPELEELSQDCHKTLSQKTDS